MVARGARCRDAGRCCLAFCRRQGLFAAALLRRRFGLGGRTKVGNRFLAHRFSSSARSGGEARTALAPRVARRGVAHAALGGALGGNQPRFFLRICADHAAQPFADDIARLVGIEVDQDGAAAAKTRMIWIGAEGLRDLDHQHGAAVAVRRRPTRGAHRVDLDRPHLAGHARERRRILTGRLEAQGLEQRLLPGFGQPIMDFLGIRTRGDVGAPSIRVQAPLQIRVPTAWLRTF